MGYFHKGKNRKKVKKGKGKKGARGGVGSGAGRGGKVAEEVGVARDWGAGLPRELLEAVAPEDRFCFRLVCRGWAEAGGSAEGGAAGGAAGQSRVAARRRDVRLLACISFGPLAGAGAPAHAPDADKQPRGPTRRTASDRVRPRRTAASVARVNGCEAARERKTGTNALTPVSARRQLYGETWRC